MPTTTTTASPPQTRRGRPSRRTDRAQTNRSVGHPGTRAQRARIAARNHTVRASVEREQRRGEDTAAEIVEGLRAGLSLAEVHHLMIRPIISPEFGEQEALALRDSLRALHDAGLLGPLIAERAARQTLAEAEALLAESRQRTSTPRRSKHASASQTQRATALITLARRSLSHSAQP